MTLAEWLRLWPYAARTFPPAIVVPDSWPDDRALRAMAYSLTDYRVSSVSGGSIWFVPRAEQPEGGQ